MVVVVCVCGGGGLRARVAAQACEWGRGVLARCGFGVLQLCSRCLQCCAGGLSHLAVLVCALAFCSP